ncbi:MAG TPA: O-antigen ligase family protein [Ktedonobacterales bacterium]|nr:O-antigen ligase family protein [Ktedonobacterales bacterium]
MPRLAWHRLEQHFGITLVYFRRTLGFWWYRVLLVALAGCLAGVLGVFVLTFPKPVLGAVAMLIPTFWAIRRLEFGLVALGILATPLLPTAFSVKSLDIYPAEPLFALLIVVIAVQTAFRTRAFVWPSFQSIWPLLGLIVLAVASTLAIQVTWIPVVSHRINGSPIIFDELLGIGIYCVPVLTIVLVSACVTNRDRWIEHLLTAFLVLAAVVSVIVGAEFRRLGSDVSSFRYTERNIFYMPLGSLAQLIALGAIIAYARLLLAERWRPRLVYGGLLVLYLVSVYVTLEMSHWLEVGVALIVMTLIFSRRLLATYGALALLLLPLLPVMIAKIESKVTTKDISRLTIWQDMIRVWSKRPILGVGPGNLWSYDQAFTQLPLLLRNLNKSGLGVAHNGPLQLLGEVGPLGVFCMYAFLVIALIAAVRLIRRSNTAETRGDRAFGLICAGLICGSVAGDVVAGTFLLPPAQVGDFNILPEVLITWMVLGCLIYKDQVWRVSNQVRARALTGLTR